MKENFPNFSPNQEEKRFPYPIELILTSCALVTNAQKSAGRKDPIRAMLLYCFADMGESYLPLNREYKPLGLTGYDKWATSQDYPFLYIPKKDVDISSLREMETNTEPPEMNLFLFVDISYPDMKLFKLRYLKKILDIFKASYPDFRDRLLEIVKGYDI